MSQSGDPGTLGHRDTGTPGHRDKGTPGHWDPGAAWGAAAEPQRAAPSPGPRSSSASLVQKYLLAHAPGFYARGFYACLTQGKAASAPSEKSSRGSKEVHETKPTTASVFIQSDNVSPATSTESSAASVCRNYLLGTTYLLLLEEKDLLPFYSKCCTPRSVLPKRFALF